MKFSMPIRTASLAAVILSLSPGCSGEQAKHSEEPSAAQAEITPDQSPQLPRHIDYLGSNEDPVRVRAAMAARILRLAKEANETTEEHSDQGRQMLGATADGLKLTYHYQLESGTSISHVLSEYSPADIASICESLIHQDNLLRGAIYAFRYSTEKSQSEVQVVQGDCE